MANVNPKERRFLVWETVKTPLIHWKEVGDKLLKTNLLILSKFLQYVWVFFSLKKKKKKSVQQKKNELSQKLG